MTILILGDIMSNKTLKIMSKNYKLDKVVNLLKSIYEHSQWVPERLFSGDLNEIVDKKHLQKKMQETVDNASKNEKLNLIKSHPELGNKLQKSSDLTKFSKDEQKSAGLDQCSEEEYETLNQLNERYREKFNFPFIIAVKGISKKKIIEQMRKRVLNTENVEFKNAITEIHKIAEIRIQEIDFET